MLRTFFLILLLVAAVTGLLLLAVNPNKPSETQTTTVPTPAQTTLVMLDSSSATGAARTIDVRIDTGNNKVTGIQLEIAYDPEILTNVDIEPGAFFENPVTLLKEVNTEDGRISYALGVAPAIGGVYGAGTVATLSFGTASSSGQTKIDFLPKTLVSGEGIIQSVLKSATGITINLSQ